MMLLDLQDFSVFSLVVLLSVFEQAKADVQRNNIG